MLKLTRRVNESIMIHTSDGPIEILISKINGNQVGVGISAPSKITILRKELMPHQREVVVPYEIY